MASSDIAHGRAGPIFRRYSADIRLHSGEYRSNIQCLTAEYCRVTIVVMLVEAESEYSVTLCILNAGTSSRENNMSKSRKTKKQSKIDSLKKIVEALYGAGMQVDIAREFSNNNESDIRQNLDRHFYVYCGTLLGKLSDDIDDLLLHLESELDDVEACNE